MLAIPIFSIPWFHIINFLVFVLALGSTIKLYCTKKQDWQKILPWVLLTVHWLIFYTFLLLRDFNAIQLGDNIFVGTPTVFFTMWSSLIITQAGASILGLTVLCTQEARQIAKLPVKYNGELEQEAKELVDEILTAANGDNAVSHSRS